MGDFYLDKGGSYGKGRKEFKCKDYDYLIKLLKREFNFKRKAYFYIPNTLDSGLISKLENLFKKSKIELKVVKNLEDF